MTTEILESAVAVPVTNPRPWTVTEISPTVHRLVFHNIKGGWEGDILLMADEHWDNAHTDLELLKEEHDEAVRRNAPILKIGDVLCLMQGKWDKRAAACALRPEHHGDNYLDLVTDTASDWYAPYAKNIALITPGNHEASIQERYQTDMTDRLLEGIKYKSGVKVFKGGYTGFVLVGFEQEEGHIRDQFVIHYHHGYGGGGEVTRGMIDNNRTRGQYMADVYVSGHIHRRNSDENTITTVTMAGLIEKRQQWFLRCSTYKDEAGEGKGGYHVKNGRAGRPKGGWWLHMTFKNKQVSYKPVPT